MSTRHHASRATPLVSSHPSLSPADHFQRGYQSGAHAAHQEQHHGVAPLSAEELFTFIATRLDPLQQARQRDATRNPLPLAWHAGFVAGYLATVFTPAADLDQPERRPPCQ